MKFSSSCLLLLAASTSSSTAFVAPSAGRGLASSSRLSVVTEPPAVEPKEETANKVEENVKTVETKVAAPKVVAPVAQASPVSKPVVAAAAPVETAVVADAKRGPLEPYVTDVTDPCMLGRTMNLR